MQKQLELTDLEKSFLEKASVVVKSHMANDIISGSLSSNDEYIRTLKNWMWKELNLRDATIQIIESHKSRYMKFSGINPHVIIKEMVSGLDDMFLSTRKEYEEGTEAWVRTLNGIKDFIGQYPFESHYNIILPAKKIEVILPEGYEFKVSIKKGKSPVDI
ncbi:MAG: hypothetical protein MJZ16_12875, partial [Bacteroidales bacterium]|nr:hypothetical protein [Bacteroidales bacterium]